MQFVLKTTLALHVFIHYDDLCAKIVARSFYVSLLYYGGEFHRLRTSLYLYCQTPTHHRLEILWTLPCHAKRPTCTFFEIKHAHGISFAKSYQKKVFYWRSVVSVFSLQWNLLIKFRKSILWHNELYEYDKFGNWSLKTLSNFGSYYIVIFGIN